MSIDLGSGVSVRFVSWSPDRELNPQYVDVPDVEKWGVILKHSKLDDTSCEGFCTFDGEIQRRISPEVPKWTVEKLDPLTLSPSIRCACGFHGFIKEGRWINA